MSTSWKKLFNGLLNQKSGETVLSSDQGYDIILTENQWQNIVSRHDEEVADKIVNRLQTKQEELEWVESQDQLSKRFHTFFGKDGVHFAEPGFEAHNTDWRAVLILIRKADTFVFHREVRKQGNYGTSKQKEIICSLKANPKEAKKKSMDILLEYESGQAENLVD